MFANLRQLKTMLHADIPLGTTADGRVTLHIAVPIDYVREPDRPAERRVRDALRELNASLQDLARARVRALQDAQGNVPELTVEEVPSAAEARRRQFLAVMTVLDEAELPKDTGRTTAREELRRRGITASNDLLDEVIETRRG